MWFYYKKNRVKKKNRFYAIINQGSSLRMFISVTATAYLLNNLELKGLCLTPKNADFLGHY